jgi:pimeloyl-ACP methyl ester carboxylesterase
MGSAAILRAVALQGVQPAAVIAECPFDRLLSTVENRFAAFGLPAFPLAHLLVFWGGVQQGFNGFAHNPADYAQAVTCPVLLLHGDADPRVTREQLLRVHDNLAGTKKLEWFAGVGHESYLAAQPEKWKDTVERFLDGLAPIKRLTPPAASSATRPAAGRCPCS